MIHESSEVEPITGLGFREASSINRSASGSKAPDSDKPGSSSLSLFIVTTNRVLSAVVSGRGSEARTIDDKGCGLGCATMDWERQAMIVARDEGIFLYGPEDRGECYAYEGVQKTVLSALVDFRSQIIYIGLRTQPSHHFTTLLPFCKLQFCHSPTLRQERTQRHLQRYSKSDDIRFAEQVNWLFWDL